jgi:hypothetical protein
MSAVTSPIFLPPAPRARAAPGRALRAASFAVTLSAAALAAADPPGAASTPEAPPSPAPTASASAGPTSADVQADLRFHEGKALLEQGLVPEACDKLAQSLALARRGGTLLNLAVCRQRQGRHATALELFQEALAVARAEGRADRAEIAERGVLDTRGKLSWLVVTVRPDPGVSDLRVTLDGAPIDPSALGSMLAVDPGQHILTAEASGRRRFEVTVTSGGAGDRRAVEIPVLAAETPTPGSAAAAKGQGPSAGAGRESPRAADSQTGMLAAGASLISVGVVAAVTGAVLGGVAIADGAESRRLCPESPCSSDEGIAKNNSARTAATAANILVPSGLTVAAVGGALLLIRGLTTSKSAAVSPSLAVAPWAAPGSGGAVLSGAW